MRARLGVNGSEFGNGDLEVRQDFQKIGLEFFICAVDFVQQQNGGGLL